MFYRQNSSENMALAGRALKWVLILVPMALIVGSACAFFLWILDVATTTRWEHPWLLYLLPAAGVAVGLVYHWIGRSVESGNNLILEQIHTPGGGVPRRMAPLILFATVLTHLFGGSAGREGTAVQMGGSIASGCARFARLEAGELRVMLMAGVAAGFGGVFGTPLAGAVFALEVLLIGTVKYEALLPCFIASVIADWSCTAWGIRHTAYHIIFKGDLNPATGIFELDGWLLAKVVVAAALFGLVSLLFSEMSHRLHAFFKRISPYAPWRPAIGGAMVIGLTLLVGTQDYLGLGVKSPDPHAATIVSFFTQAAIHPWSWWWKIVFTAVTLSCGFKGGEVTPLFYIGAATGNVLAWVLGAPTDLFAALGFVAVFAGAANTPLACTIMGIELFGSAHVIYIATACFLAYVFSGHSGIYLSQRVDIPKSALSKLPPQVSLRDVRQIQPPPAAETEKVVNNAGGVPMSQQHKVKSREIGMIRIYLKPGDRRPARGLKARLASRPLYKELVEAAKQDGIINAVAHHTHYGYSNHGELEGNNPEIQNPALTMCVELIGAQPELDLFCRKHGALLQDKVIIYKHIEHWEVHAQEVIKTDVPVEELLDEEAP